MDDRTLTEIALDELWALHQMVASILASKLETQTVRLRIGCGSCVQVLRRTSRKNRLAVNTPRFRRSFAIQLSRTKHGPDEANNRRG